MSGGSWVQSPVWPFLILTQTAHSLHQIQNSWYSHHLPNHTLNGVVHYNRLKWVLALMILIGSGLPNSKEGWVQCPTQACMTASRLYLLAARKYTTNLIIKKKGVPIPSRPIFRHRTPTTFPFLPLMCVFIDSISVFTFILSSAQEEDMPQ